MVFGMAEERCKIQIVVHLSGCAIKYTAKVVVIEKGQERALKAKVRLQATVYPSIHLASHPSFQANGTEPLESHPPLPVKHPSDNEIHVYEYIEQ